MSQTLNSVATSRRIAAIDRLRGLCVVSMIFGHFAKQSMVSKLIHAPLWVDGAMGFVMVSGLVVGIVRHRTLERGGTLGQVTKASIRRSGQLWLLATSMCLLALGPTYLASRDTRIPPVELLGGWSKAIVDVLTLQVSFLYIDLLTIYVFILALSPLFIWLLTRRPGTNQGLIWAIAVTAAIYLLDILAPIDALHSKVYWMADSNLESAQVLVAGRWLALFNIGLFFGWRWNEAKVILARPKVWRTLAVLAVAFTFIARGIDHFFGDQVPTWLIDKVSMAPGTMVFGVVLVLALTQVLERRDRTDLVGVAYERSMDLVAQIGRFSLASYVIHLIVLLAAEFLIGMPLANTTGLVLSVATLGLCYGWSLLPRGTRHLKVTSGRPAVA